MKQRKPASTFADAVSDGATSSLPSSLASFRLPLAPSQKANSGLLTPSQRESMSRACELMIALDHRGPTGRQLRRRQAKLARKLGVK